MNEDYRSELIAQHSAHLENIVRRNMPSRLRRRLDAEDVVQSVFRSFFRRRDQGELADDVVGDLGSLLVTMTLNKVRNAIQFHQRQCRDVRLEFNGDGAHQNSAASDADRSEWSVEHEAVLSELLERLLTGLPEVHREIVILRMAGQSMAEIARHVSRSERTVIRVLTGLAKLAREHDL